jgi:hypothetical protein
VSALLRGYQGAPKYWRGVLDQRGVEKPVGRALGTAHGPFCGPDLPKVAHCARPTSAAQRTSTTDRASERGDPHANASAKSTGKYETWAGSMTAALSKRFVNFVLVGGQFVPHPLELQRYSRFNRHIRSPLKERGGLGDASAGSLDVP